MNSTLTPRHADAHEKTIDLRVLRLHDAISRAHALTTTADSSVRASAHRRVLTVLMENRVFVAAHTQALIEQIIATTPADQQDTLIAEQVRPLTILLEQANVHIARLRHHLGEHE